MPYELKNKLRGPSYLRVIDGATPNLALSAFSANVNTENVSSLTLTSVKWSVHPTAGQLTIARDGLLIMNVHQTGYWQHDDLAIANSPSANILVTITGGGTAIIGVSKHATYNVQTQDL